MFIKELKKTLREREFLILFDSVENFALFVHNSIQSQHLNNYQTTILTVGIHYIEDNKHKHISMAILCDNLSVVNFYPSLK